MKNHARLCMYVSIHLFTIKSPVVTVSTCVPSDFKMSLKQRPISFFECRDTAQISKQKMIHIISVKTIFAHL